MSLSRQFCTVYLTLSPSPSPLAPYCKYRKIKCISIGIYKLCPKKPFCNPCTTLCWAMPNARGNKHLATRTLFINYCIQYNVVRAYMILKRSWTIIALSPRTLTFYFWSNIELAGHECSFMPQITNYKDKIMNEKFLDLF